MKRPQQKRRTKTAIQTGRQKLRIIGGDWRGRKLEFPDLPGLRPTTDRVRETLFNWLQTDIPSAQCLDLFAGSGALGIEALSRGAKRVTFIEKNPIAAQHISQHLSQLKAENGQCISADACQWLQVTPAIPMDVIFLDPPFRQTLLPNVCSLLSEQGWLKPHSLIYVETEKEIKKPEVPANWLLLKEKTAGQLTSFLFEVKNL